MTNKQKSGYEPSRKEVFKEMCDYSKNCLSKKWTLFKKNSAYSVKKAMFIATYLYYIPTTIRKCLEKDNIWLEKKEIPENYQFAGLVGGISLLMPQTIGYILLRQEYPELLLIPLATNVFSGAYELGRYQYEKARDRLIESNKKNLSKLL